METLEEFYTQILDLDFLIEYGYYDRNVKSVSENKTIGILLSTDKNETIVKYTLPEDNKTIFSSEFKLAIPSEKEFINVIENEKKNMELVDKID